TETYTAEGNYTVHADEATWTGKGYEFTNGASRDVYVDANGTASPSEIIFNVKVYEEPVTPISVTIPISYLNQANNAVIASDSVTYTQAGEYTIDATAQEGFELVDPTSVLVTVLTDGTASHSAVTFYATQKTDPDPVEELTPINSDGVTIKANLNLRSAPIVETGNEVFKGVKKDVTVWVYGSVVNSVGETWYKIKYQETDCYIRQDMLKLVETTAKSADVKIQYIDQASGTAFFEDQVTIDAGAQQEIKVDVANAAGYTLQSESTVVVTVDAEGVANINPVVFTFTKNEVTGTVHTEYVDENGVYATEDLTLGVGDQQPITPNANHVKAGYTLTSEPTVMVNVSADGSVLPSTVTFTYQAPVVDVKADVTFTYTDMDGNAIAGLDANTITLAKGTYSTVDYRKTAPDGYLFDHASHDQIVIDENGANPAAVQFFYSKQEVLGTMTFYFLDDQNNEMSSKQTIQLAPNTYDAANFAMVAPEDYTYQGASAANFTINAQGDASPASITYTYVRNTVAPADVSISYVDPQGGDIYPSTTRKLAAGMTYPASDFLLVAPEGYDYVGASADQIVVDAAGVATPASITFTYQTSAVVTGDVVIQYKTTTGNAEVSPSTTVSLEQGENDMNEHISVFPGYTFDSKSADFVTVTKDGKANPSTVTFYYTKDVTSTTIQVHYVNAIGEDFANSPQLVMIGKGTHNIRPDAAYVPAGYELSTSSAQIFEIVVNDQMIATPNSITFKYYDSTKNANITVGYINQVTGATIATRTVSRAPGTHAIEPESGAVDMTKFNLAPASPSSVNVTVTEQSVASPAAVTFYYVPVEIEAYMGYLLTINQANLFSMASNLEGQILQTLPVNTLLYTNGQKTQSNGVVWNSAYTVLGTTNAGYVKNSDVKRISQAEAEALIAKYNEENKPTPEQSTGYYITRGNNVPFRKAADPYASAKYLPVDTVIYVLGQTTAYNYDWHQAQYQGVTGYVRTDQVRKMTEDEVKAYLASQKDPETPGTGTEVTNDPNSNSSYGYVSGSSVNFRATPNGTRLKTIKKYGMALVLGTKEVNGVTWYNVNYNGTIGWIHGSYFYQMTLAEMRSFVGSTEYNKGLSSNSISNGTSGSSSGSTGSSSGSSGSSSGTSSQGGLASVEDGNAGTWQNTGVTGQTSYEPFNPYATPSVTTSVQPSESPEPSPTLAIGTMIPIDYDDESKETQTGTVPWGLLGAAGVLICGAGGVYAYALNQNKRRKTAAQRAAAGRKAAQGAAGSKTAQNAAGSKTTQGAAGSTSTQQGQNPYARRAVVAPPVTGTKQNQNAPTTPQSPTTGATTGGVRNPYASGSITGASTTGNPYAKPQSTTPQSTAAPILPPSGASTNAGTPIGRPSGSSAPIQGTAGSASMTRPSSLSASDVIAPTTGATGSSMTRPSSLSGSSAAVPTASTGTNPYAKPISTMPMAPTAPTEPTAPAAPTTASSAPEVTSEPITPRRSRRMQRYHEAEGSDTDSE
ncbi:MAG: hypothetical protein GX096_12035, partial [Clostridiales bacterium]|nr:hypothetical protein [Clostridiales bacterium]